ncbi:MAG: tRNA (N6-isopentenyl adenosine(37)-C2)-methylthiotransferase MiaB [Mucinivorans sp.]
MRRIDPKALFFANHAGGLLHIETYGCQMNSGDSEVVASIMKAQGWGYTDDIHQADLILVNTCAIRDNAEQRVWGRLVEMRSLKRARPWLLVGVIGCMAERLKNELTEREQAVDIVAGPDSYRTLPELVRAAANGLPSINTKLSTDETYCEIEPVRFDKNGVSGFVSIMRGCNNMCAYCVVPYTRGTERSRPWQSIVDEAQKLFEQGYREVTLLGQNVNSYNFEGVNFASLLSKVAAISPLLRLRFSTSHPKDLSDEVIATMATTPNICRSIHLPAQSGSNRMLALMNRKYTREWYLDRIAAIRRAMPDCSISTDLIAGFCSETLEEHQMTMELMREVGYDFSYMFKYSERPNTKAARTMADDITEQEKTRRLSELITLQNELSLQSNSREVGRRVEVLIESLSRRSTEQLSGRSSQNKVVVFDRQDCKIGDYVQVEITQCSSATLKGKIIK